MKLGKRTARLVREAAIAGFVAGNRYGSHALLPADSAIWLAALWVASDFPDLYPTLSVVARGSEELAEEERRQRAATAEFLQQRLNGEGSP
jgi:hypothetical protein